MQRFELLFIWMLLLFVVHFTSSFQTTNTMMMRRLVSTASDSASTIRRYPTQSLTKRYLNRIFFDRQELTINPETNKLMASLPAEDNRHKHIRDILKLVPGDRLKCGVLNEGLCDDAHITYITGEDTSDDTNSVPHGDGNVENLSDDEELNVRKVAGRGATTRSGTIQIELCKEENLEKTTTSSSTSSSSSRPQVDLILALPRPLRLEKILPTIACLGVRRLFLIKAEKVEADYFGSHLLRRPALMKELLVEGLSQACVDYHVPEVVIVKKKFSYWLQPHPHKRSKPSSPFDVPAFDQYFVLQDSKNSEGKTLKIVAHPPKPESLEHSKRLFTFFQEQLKQAEGGSKGFDRVVLAIGPEGGWEESEVDALRGKGFQQIDLGGRILRTDIAVSVLLGMVNELLAIKPTRALL